MAAFGFSGDSTNELKSKIDAIMRSQAVIEFTLDGFVTDVNDNFLAATGYKREDVVGQHHRMFVGEDYARSSDYADFWKRLAKGEFFSGEFRRFGKGGKEVWLQATYNPILNRAGRPTKVIKFASDISQQKNDAADKAGKVDAILKSQAVIEFELDGTVITANKNFLDAMGYELSEIQGKHHRMFVDKTYASSPEYADFWKNLRKGNFVEDQFKRFGKGGKEVWIRASYNPVFNANGDVVKVVKFARDITERKNAERVLHLMRKSLGEMADGNLECDITEKFTGEYEELSQAFNSCLTRFRGIVGQMRKSSETLRFATGELLEGSNDLAERTTRQAAAIEETSASMEELSGAIVDSAKKAETAREAADKSSAIAADGGEVMNRATSAMTRISQSSEKISNIIKLIDDIAFQTNLLALNASVEAARAGEAGKGFAVVAVEVRRLAQSAADASSEVKELIEQSASEVGEGTKLVSEAASKLEAMLDSIQKNGGLMREIAQASHQQASSIKGVATAIREMDDMTQHNAALVEETNAAIEQTEGQAAALEQIVEIFKKTRDLSSRERGLNKAA